ncbi:carbohydrate-binding module 1 protein [Lobosporangium transversale]|uniref:Calcipressin-domain-containing protein n=1 Tax=Lobosporangium transversale TaxID=64571 RepID=A0A1Y2GQF7_9FUNG|nr:Calcipressin-domain-containing protein [Lobosporangium transversale]KAF9913918.1 carbohydrate-binding module 1 protein [Lobosporangium transversale]ORZ19125.1 Calcipressin-domain-containing protein [Lobosporangium transversale]|eukprot:XP_021882293.1 Calcipressin-domain-containing protein [Lobosporangium transversale]
MSESVTPTPTLPTNTLMVTNLEAPHFEKETMLKLKAKVEEFGEVYYFAPIKSFYRVFVVYHSTFDAQRAKALLHNTTFEGTTIRVYFGQHTEISADPASRYLHPPELEKNWLISPPGSPPIGWTQIREDPPNAVHLADDLVKALLDMGQPVYQLPRPDGTFADRSHLFLAHDEIEDLSLGEAQKPQEYEEHEQHVNATSSGVESKGATEGATEGAGAGAGSTKTEAEAAVQQQQGAKKSLDESEKEIQERLQHQIRGLKIDTHKPPATATSSTPASTNALGDVGSPASSLFPPATPTVLAFSPAKESAGDQPFITVQDWGADPNYVPTPLKRRGTIPKTAFPTGPIRNSTPTSPSH